MADVGQRIAKRRTRRRLDPETRRAEIVHAAGRLLTAHGLDGVPFTEVAARAGVTRPVVYKFFSDRDALLRAVVEDFVAELRSRFAAAFAYGLPHATDLESMTGVFIHAVCDTIEAKGAGAWRLLGAKDGDREIRRLGEEQQRSLLAPWLPRIAEMTRASPREVETLSRMLVAAGRVVLEQWYDGELTRADAARDATRGVSALLQAFTRKHPNE